MKMIIITLLLVFMMVMEVKATPAATCTADADCTATTETCDKGLGKCVCAATYMEVKQTSGEDIKCLLQNDQACNNNDLCASNVCTGDTTGPCEGPYGVTPCTSNAGCTTAGTTCVDTNGNTIPDLCAVSGTSAVTVSLMLMVLALVTFRFL